MYTWGYLKDNTLSKLNLDEVEANQQGLLSRFAFYANEAMTQICSAIRPNERYFEIVVDGKKVDKEIPFPQDFIAFSDDLVFYKPNPITIAGQIVNTPTFDEVGDDYVQYYGYNQIICKREGTYRVPYKARWFFFTKDLTNDVIINAPADVLEAIPSYIASQCWKIDDELRASIYRNEYEMFLARIDDTSFKSQRTLHRGGGW